MNILILGDASAPALKDFCIHVLSREDNVCIFSYTNLGRFSELYAELGIKEVYIIPYFENRWITVFTRLFKNTHTIKALLPFEKCDVVHMHYVSPSMLVHLIFFWMTSKKRILTFWGSDLLRKTSKDRKLLNPFLCMASSLVFMIPGHYAFFRGIYGNLFRKKAKIIDFGNDLLDLIENIRKECSKADCKKEFGLADDKITIHIGYNKDRMQQHKRIVEQICRLPKAVLEAIQCVFPWAYGGSEDDDKYADDIKQQLILNGVKYEFVTDFMQGDKLAKFRMTCDILAYAQTTDGMSDSVIEYVYSDCVFLCPEWLWSNYSLINNYPDRCIRYDNFEDMGENLCEIISQWKHGNLRPINRELISTIYKHKSWDSLSNEWRKCYE